MKTYILMLNLLAVSLFSLPTIGAPSLSNMVFNAEGEQVSLEEFKGQVVYVDFWASWCGPCRKSFPWMDAMHAKYQLQGLAIVTINLDSNKALADKFLADFEAKFHVRYDPDGDTASQFELQGMPSSYVFNRQGELVQRHVGFFKKHTQAYEQQLVQLLQE